jgi:hypothetical protein
MRRFSKEPHTAGIRLEETKKCVNGSGFSRAVWTNESDDTCRLHFHAESLYGEYSPSAQSPAVTLRQLIDLNDGLSHRRFLRETMAG